MINIRFAERFGHTPPHAAPVSRRPTAALLLCAGLAAAALLAPPTGLATARHAGTRAGTRHGQAGVDLTLASQLPGSFTRVWSEASFAYVTGQYAPPRVATGGLHLVRVAEPTSPEIVGSLSGGYGAASRGPCLFLPNNHGLSVYDTTFPGAPGRVGGYVIPGSTWALGDVVIAGDIAYAAHGWYGLEIFDVSRPRSILHLATVDLPGDSQSVAVSGDLVAVANGLAGISLVEVSDPASPRQLADYSEPDLDATDVALAGKHLFVAGDGGEPWLIPSGLPPTADGLWVLDVTDPARPRRTARVTYGVNQTYKLQLDQADGLVYLAMQGLGLKAFDLSHPEAPKERPIWQPDGLPMDVRAEGDRLYVASRGAAGRSGGMAILRNAAASRAASRDSVRLASLTADLGFRLFFPATMATSCR